MKIKKLIGEVWITNPNKMLRSMVLLRIEFDHYPSQRNILTKYTYAERETTSEDLVILLGHREAFKAFDDAVREGIQKRREQ